MPFWYRLWSFGVFFPFWHVWTNKNLATLAYTLAGFDLTTPSSSLIGEPSVLYIILQFLRLFFTTTTVLFSNYDMNPDSYKEKALLILMVQRDMHALIQLWQWHLFAFVRHSFFGEMPKKACGLFTQTVIFVSRDTVRHGATGDTQIGLALIWPRNVAMSRDTEQHDNHCLL
jgi:hypothetical protein